jgi:virginiamycin B lyase
VLWFTGQSGIYGKLDPSVGVVQTYDAPRGPGPYGITTAPDGKVFYASLAGSHVAQINLETAQATPIDPPTPRQGARRVWTDSHGIVWISEWNAGQVGRYDPVSGDWHEWKLPGNRAQTYAVFVDDQDQVWLSQWGNDTALVHFDPSSESFQSFPLDARADVREIYGRPGEVWAAESGRDRLVVVRTR